MTARLVGWLPNRQRLDSTVGTVARVGATPDNDVVVRIDGVSRTHARIVQQPDGYWLEDAGSRNGTWLNGERVTRARLRHLDVITLGRFADVVFVERGGEVSAPEPVTEVVQARLEWLDGPARGTIMAIPHGEIIIGRAESCGIVIDSDAISRAHARLTITGEGVTLEDLGSVNGTLRDGRPVTRPVTLESGAEVDVGGARRFRVLIDGAAAAGAARLEGATPIGAQDMEWATRLVWSASDLLGAQGGGVAGIPLAPSPQQSPAGPGAAKEIKPAAVPAASVQSQPSTDRELGTIRDAPGPEAPPAFEPAPTSSSRPSTERAGPPLERPPQLGAAQGASTQLGVELGRGMPPVPTTLKPPPASVLGFRDVGPTPRAGAGARAAPAASGGSSSAAETSLPSTTAPIESIRLSGALGVFVIPRGTATVGRAMDATVRIDSREMSRIHSVLHVTDQAVTVEDRGSVNGTSVNGTPMTGTRALADGDRVSFADFEFRVEFTRTEGTS